MVQFDHREVDAIAARQASSVTDGTGEIVAASRTANSPSTARLA